MPYVSAMLKGLIILNVTRLGVVLVSAVMLNVVKGASLG
jgi:hypothetical protein